MVVFEYGYVATFEKYHGSHVLTMYMWMGIKGYEEMSAWGTHANVSGTTLCMLDIQLDHLLHEDYVVPKVVSLLDFQQLVH